MNSDLRKGGFIIFVLFGLLWHGTHAEDYVVSSPDHLVSVTVLIDSSLSYSVKYQDKYLILPSEISMIIKAGKGSGAIPLVLDASIASVNNLIYPVIKEKQAEIPDVYNELIVKFDNQTELHFRVYNDGVAYRFASKSPGIITVINEEANFHFPPSTHAYYPRVLKRPDADIFHTSFEEPYSRNLLDSISNDILAFTPVLLELPGLPKVLITESDVYDYPGMFLTGTDSSALKGRFAPYPLKEIISGGEFKQKQVVERDSFIAKTNGTRTFPWRVIVIAPEDKDLLINDLVFRLAPDPDFTVYDWIKPGISTEEWITGLNLYGVNFEAGLNTATYKYYIDFAARFGFEYVMLDAGWSDVNDLFKITPGMDMEEITGYAMQKGIGIILWTQALTIERQMQPAFQQFKNWGVKIIMTDFIDRDDQQAINFMHWFAGECARNNFMCMIHGAPKPAGFSRTYPNMLTREGVLGSEYNIWSDKANPEHDLLLPFIRMASGPMDYEPGILQHATKEQTSKLGFEKVIAQGTRMHQIAMFVIYESPLQLFSGNLSDAYREPELMHFLGKIPTVWDETRILDAQLGKHILEARRKGDVWYLAAINNWEPCTFNVPLYFLRDGVFLVETASDGINAARNPQDYRLEQSEVTRNDTITIKLAPGGGFVARIF